jgi:Tfp pilus assembly protein FimV
MKFSTSLFQIFRSSSPVTILGITPLMPNLLGLFLRQKPILQEVNWSGANLQDANLQEVNWSGANLQDANLRGADLKNANLRGADLQDADLSGADLSGADLQNADLSGADLSGADLRDADLSGADLRDADLSGATLHDTNLQGANLNGAVCPPCVRFVLIEEEFAGEPQGEPICLSIDDPTSLIDVIDVIEGGEAS